MHGDILIRGVEEPRILNVNFSFVQILKTTERNILNTNTNGQVSGVYNVFNNTHQEAKITNYNVHLLYNITNYNLHYYYILYCVPILCIAWFHNCNVYELQNGS